MAVENASTPDQLDASLPAGTDFKNEGDNHIRLIKNVIKTTLQGIVGSATQTEAQNIANPGSNKIMTALRVFEQVTARIATQQLAEGGADNSRLMTSLRTKQYTDARLATGTTATAGSDGVKLMSSLATKQYVDARLSSQTQAEGLSDNTTLTTPLRAGQAAQRVFDNNYSAKIATQTQQNAGTADNVTTTPLKARVANDARYLRLAQTTTFTRSLLDDANAGTVRSTLGLGNAAVANLSSSVSSTATDVAANSAAVKAAYDEAIASRSRTQETFGANNAIVFAVSLVNVAQGGTVAGSNLRATSISSGYNTSGNLSVTLTFGSTLSGTWRNLGAAVNAPANGRSDVSVFIRIS